MPNWDALLGDLPAVQFVAWVAAIGALVWLGVRLWPFVKNSVAVVDALLQLPEMHRRMESLEGKVDGIYHETHTNDGSSVKDAVDRIERAVSGINRVVGSLRDEDDKLWIALEQTQGSDDESGEEGS